MATAELVPPIRPLAGTHAGQWDAWTDRRADLPPNYAADASARQAILAQTQSHLAPFRTALGLDRDPSFEQGLATMLHRPDWVRASVAMHDALVLAEFVRSIRPERVLEIGTASGFSAAAMLWAMDQHASAAPAAPDAVHHTRPSDPTTPWIESFDISPACYFDPDHASGSAAQDMVPALARHLRTHTGDARQASTLLRTPSHRFSLAFIDACHDHPWPTLDLLWIAPLLTPGAWVVLHDVAYSRILDAKRAREGRSPKRSEYGPEALFEAWPGEKVIGDGWAGNIAAIRIDDPLSLSAILLRESLERPWERPVSPEFAAIAGPFVPL